MSGVSKDLLVFDATHANDSDNVGAFIRGASGEIVTSTLVSGKQALDVNMVNNISVDISAADGDSVLISDGVDNLAINADGSLNAVVSATDLDIRNLTFATDKVDVSGSSVTVSATDLDIRNLVFATDKVDVTGSSVELGATTLAALETITVLQGTSPWAIGDGGGSITVDAADLDIRDLNSATDSVAAVVSGNVADDAVDSGNPVKVGSRALTGPLSAISSGDRADLISDLYRRIYINDSANIGLASTAAPVADSAVNLIASPLGGRRELLVQNLSSQPIFVGPSGVSIANGTRIAAGASGSFKVGPNVALYAISANATAKDVRVLELA